MAIDKLQSGVLGDNRYKEAISNLEGDGNQS